MCIYRVSEWQGVTRALHLLVFADGPRISCDSASAFVGDRDVYLRCEVRARPPPTALYWVLDDDNSTTRIRDGVAGHYGQDYWTVATVSLLLPPLTAPHAPKIPFLQFFRLI